MIRKISIWGTALKLLFPAHCLRRGRGPHTLLNQNSLCVVKWQQRRWQVCTKAPAAKSSAAHLPTHALSLSVRMWGCQPGCSTRWQWRPKHRDRPKCGWASPEQAVLLHSCSLRIDLSALWCNGIHHTKGIFKIPSLLFLNRQPM